MNKIQIPKNILTAIEVLEKNNFEAFLVGGCVRDFSLNKIPKDWDIATNAKPEDMIKVFNEEKIKTLYENSFGTVVVFVDNTSIEITTYRIEGDYNDKRHPENVNWTENLKEDLKRRDFTINAMAMNGLRGTPEIVDLFNGKKDLKDKIIKTVGDPDERFSEDALRMLRAIRFATVLGEEWIIEKNTFNSIVKNKDWLSKVSNERIRDEFVKIISSPYAKKGILLLKETGLLHYIIPELELGYDCMQNKHHMYDVFTHNLESLSFAVKKDYNLHIRIAALLHDIAKPETKRGKGENATFYNHEIIGAQITKKILNRLKFSKKDIDKIVNLVRYHLFYYNVEEVTESSIRRLVKNVGLENMNDLIKLRMCDRIGSGCPKAEPYKLRHLKYLIEKVSKDPISVKMIKIDGSEIMNLLDINPSKKIGLILDILLAEILESPEKNNKKYLKERTLILGSIVDEELESLAAESKKEVNSIITKEDNMTKEKYWLV
ncbi:MAG: HD domain-containing protein [Candidatus Pacebacteria bacterium]|nr:HD domain-containing protein [Candidatus Paceibacterota bacterium]MDD3919153.1 HD domain-containing protein [Candidatus Paceibacterota bacterium]